MRLLTAQAHNIMRLEDVTCDFTGTHLFLVGGANKSGKTSLLKSLLMALCGRSGMDWPDVSLKEGEDEGWVKLALSGDEEMHDSLGFTIELLLSRQRGGQVIEKFRLLDSAGEPAPEPRTLLKQLYHYRGFDPLEFSRKSKAEQRKLLMDLCGIDFAADEEATKRLYDERTEVNREAKRAEAEAKSAVRHAGVPDKEVSTADLMATLEQRQAYNAETKRIKARIEDLSKAREKYTDDIKKLQKEIGKLKSDIEQKTTESASIVMACQSFEKQLDGRTEQDVDSIRTEIKEAGATNKKIAENANTKAAKEREAELKRASEQLSEKIKAISDDQHKRLQEADWPVDGLSIDGAGVLFDGLPFEQASSMRRTLVSAEIGMALNPKLRLLVCQGGGDLDNAALDALARLCHERDFQMVVEIVTRSKDDEDRCAVVIENGKVKSERA